MRARVSWIVLGACCAPAPACTETQYLPFADNQLAQGLRAASQTRTGVLAGLVDEIYAARIGDPDRETTYGDRCGTGKSCVYSRSATAALVRQRWSDPLLGGTATVGEQRRSDGGFTTDNIFLDIRGATRPDEWVLATAHYDAWFGGANDNATGVAVVLEAAFALQGLALDRSVRLLLFDGEELGLVGSGRYIEEFGTGGVLLDINADSVAFRGEGGGVLTQAPNSTEYWLQANEDSAEAAYQMADLANRLPRPLALKPLVFAGDGVSIVGYAVGFDLADSAQFWLAGARALFPFPVGDKPGWYHTSNDTPDKVDEDRLERSGALWAAALAAFATVRR